VCHAFSVPFLFLQAAPLPIGLALAGLLYLAGVLGYAWWVYTSSQRDVTATQTAAWRRGPGGSNTSSPDFHDRARGPEDIPHDEELRLRDLVNRYAGEMGFVYTYTLAERDGKFYFAACTVTEQEAREREVWYFYPYDDIPREFVQAFRTGKPPSSPTATNGAPSAPSPCPRPPPEGCATWPARTWTSGSSRP
jgi:hypothetical protein